MAENLPEGTMKSGIQTLKNTRFHGVFEGV